MGDIEIDDSMVSDYREPGVDTGFTPGEHRER